MSDNSDNRPRDNWFWMRNSNGKASASLTFAAISFIVITAWIFLSIFESITIAETVINTREAPSEGLIFAYLGTTFSLYFGRRYSNARAMVNEQKNLNTATAATTQPNNDSTP